jgi:peptidoglycan/LPS O-acetylase OafA/YrhL
VDFVQQSDLAKPSKQRFAFIEHLRILAFSSVLIGHLYFDEYLLLMQSQNSSVSMPLKFGNSFFAGGGGGVVLFFLISGFVIAKAAERETYQQFAVRRFFRIYPMLAVALTLYFLLGFLYDRRTPSLREVVGSYTLLGDFLGSQNQLSGVEWSLRLEILFYIAVFFVLFLKQTASWFGTKASLVLLIAVSFCLIFMPIFPQATGMIGYVTIFSPVFLGGIAIALWDSKKIDPTLALLMILFSFIVSTSHQTEIRPDTLWAGPIILFGYCIFFGAYFLRDRFSLNRPTVLLASYTYTVYLLHKWVIPLIEQYLGARLTSLHDTAVKFFSLTIFFLLVHALVTFIEQPVIRWSRKYFQKS